MPTQKEQKDFYEILGVPRDSDIDAIKKAYRKLALQFHPDKNPGNKEAEDRFKEAAEAYEILSNSEKRAQYDRFGHRAFGSGGYGGGSQFTDVEDIFSHFGDIFGDIFGMGGASQGRSKRSRNSTRSGSDLRYIVKLTLKDVILGAEKDIEFETDSNCSSCNGSGSEKGSQPETCKTCGGRGQVVRQQGFFSMASTCHHCSGEGFVIKNHCKECRGKGRVKQARKIRVTIPAGVDTGTRLRVSGEGEGGFRGGPSGDLYVEMSVAPHENFERKGDDLYAELTLDYLQILLGAKIEVETITGKKNLEIPKGSQIGDQIKLTNEGVPSLRGSRRGHLYFILGVHFPEKIGKQEEKLLREIAEERGLNIDSSSKASFWTKKKR